MRDSGWRFRHLEGLICLALCISLWEGCLDKYADNAAFTAICTKASACEPVPRAPPPKPSKTAPSPASAPPQPQPQPKAAPPCQPADLPSAPPRPPLSKLLPPRRRLRANVRPTRFSMGINVCARLDTAIMEGNVLWSVSLHPCRLLSMPTSTT